mmetsp:Transcript_27725/g.33876  ORF Transcript_27725/g.33876 Transcript_27725/m.33876 type:complete len:158 (-) Transcript_27725:148-621(-)
MSEFPLLPLKDPWAPDPPTRPREELFTISVIGRTGMTRPDEYGAGLPKNGPQASILIHKKLLDDPTVKWSGAYKHIFWTLILPNGLKNPSRPDIEVFGDVEAVDQVVELIYRHKWRPIVRGGLDVAYKFEGGKVSCGKILGNMKREMFQGEKLSVGW